MPSRDDRTADELKDAAQRWQRADLLRIWEDIKVRRPIDGWPPGKAFEYLVVQAFSLEGVTVRWPFEVEYPHKLGVMEQLDGVVYLGGRPFLLESKDLDEPTAIGAVAKLRFRLESRPPGTMAVLFSVGGFTFPTEVFTQFATPLNVLLWSGGDLDWALTAGAMQNGLQRKLDYASERGLPSLRLEE
jgi:hypothetical protein